MLQQLWILFLLLPTSVYPFVGISSHVGTPKLAPFGSIHGDKTSSTSIGSKTENNSIDVSDLGLTMEDLNKPLPPELLASIERSGYQSTSRIPDVDDNGCYWVENKGDDNGTIDVTLTIPGLRGQPAACLAVLFSTTTVSVTAFGRIVWSCIQRGISVPEQCSFFTEDGKDMIPVIQLSVEKSDKDKVWDGFILQIGEDSIL